MSRSWGPSRKGAQLEVYIRPGNAPWSTRRNSGLRDRRVRVAGGSFCGIAAGNLVARTKAGHAAAGPEMRKKRTGGASGAAFCCMCHVRYISHPYRPRVVWLEGAARSGKADEKRVRQRPPAVASAGSQHRTGATTQAGLVGGQHRRAAQAAKQQHETPAGQQQQASSAQAQRH